MGSLYNNKEGRITIKKTVKKPTSKLEQPELFDDDFDFSNLSEGRFGLTLQQNSLSPFTETDFEDVSSLTSKLSERNLIKSKSQKLPSSSSTSSKTFESEDDTFKQVHFPESMDSLTIASPQSTHLSSINENNSSQEDFWSDLVIEDDHNIAENNQSNAKPDNDDNQNAIRRKWRRKPTLIRNLNSTKRSKVVGEMVYNPDLQRWDGNESILKEFEAYLTPRNNSTLNTKNVKIIDNMIFDPKRLCWCSSQTNLEEDAFENFENSDSDDDYDKRKKKEGEASNTSNNNDSNNISDNSKLNGYNICNNHKDDADLVMSGKNSNDFTVGNEFDVTPGFLAALIASERQHGNEMSRWYPAASSLRNEQRFGLRNPNIQRGFLYEIRTVIMNKKTGRFSSRRDRFVK
ncbi:8098_t:CDS:2 [Ambispora gerdemannii]|uniref:8098_t:CDS:1 n=1 Tax=Ambispora gerdemannii TaxID=144530 RepID=A0A9N9F0T2_9GLOM|nr:8098_t:CDS:2 [Ambispora gerdemannii]